MRKQGKKGQKVRKRVTPATPTPTATPTATPVPTPTPNADGTIRDIDIGDTKRPDTNNLITTNVGKQVNYTFDEKEITIPKELCGLSEDQKYTPKNADTNWYVWYEDNEDVYIVGGCKTQLTLFRLHRF